MADVEMLKSKIADSGMKVYAVAEKSGIRPNTFYHKLSGKSEFTASEIVSLSRVLRLTPKERDTIFLQ